MIGRNQIGILLFVVVPIITLGISLYFNNIIQEEWMAKILISTTFLSGSICLLIFWFMIVVNPFLQTRTKDTITEKNQSLSITMENSYASRWIL